MTTTTAVPSPLTRLDRCDRCSAAAQIVAVLPSGELLFCGHHAREHRASLLDAGAWLSS
ncbi:MAG TPA: hypothetical protein VGJ95_12640 [Pseudonocardiaceae bacterium]